ncbi:DNA polymerase III subunit beta [candidate division WWE3 bacterium RBG_13_37_7]|uniref:DNA polymerase III subunit beta n=1 Tax=candidate division WWE3 bacterium RBG_13_37_7 TaxID=1802609 RepID=A0A1F4U1Y2_UNCKA|nr:MAG: DNA polymerase III subunit beta [candidate division WWE3 bacterium RBG_13_37_7]
MTIAATDGFRLSEKTIKVKGPDKKFTTVIPAKTFLEIARIFATYEEPIEMVLDENENLVLFKSGETLTATRILEGQYPDYKKIIPTEHTLKAIFSSEEFLEAVKLSSIFAKEGDNRMKLGFYPDEACIRVSSLEVESGEHESEFSAEIEGEFVEVAFNSKYLLDFLNNIKTETVLFNTSGNVTPCTLKPKELEDFIHVIMPIQI